MSLWVEYLNDLCSAGNNHQHVFMVARDECTSSQMMRETITDMFDWCSEFVGPHNSSWNCDTTYVMFTFENEEDAFAFRLRWC